MSAEHHPENSNHAHCSCGACELNSIRFTRLIIGALLFAASFFMEHESTLHIACVMTAYLMLGADILWLVCKNLIRGKVFDENFLMGIATLGAIIIGEYNEAAGVMLFYQVGEFFQDKAIGQSTRSIEKLMDLKPEYANVQKNGIISSAPPQEIQPDDIIIVKPGEKIPLDGVIISGDSSLDTAALTGESIPRDVGEGDTVYAGSVNHNGLLTIRVTNTFADSAVSKIIDLVRSASKRKAPIEQFITRFAKYYTPCVVGIAVLIAIISPLCFSLSWSEGLRRALVLLVISCPCALVISIPLCFFGGIGNASRNGILIKGGKYLDALTRVKTIIFDKTGTLTQGKFHVTHVYPESHITTDNLLKYAAHAEHYSNHAIGHSIKQAYTGEIDPSLLSEYTEIPGHGIKTYVGPALILAGNRKLMEKESVNMPRGTDQSTTVHIAVDGVYAGYTSISDTIKGTSKISITELHDMGVDDIVMLTGDTREGAREVANELGIDNVHAELLPQQKVSITEDLLKALPEKTCLAFVGDGINDAPALARADIGIAMGGIGSDIAIQTADIVIMNDNPAKIPLAIKIAHFTRHIVIQTIIFALGVKLIFLALGAFGAADMWEAVFADVGVALLSILNAMRTIHKKWNI